MAPNLWSLFVFAYVVVDQVQTDPNWSNFLYDEATKLINLIDFGAARDYPKSFVDDYLGMVNSLFYTWLTFCSQIFICAHLLLHVPLLRFKLLIIGFSFLKKLMWLTFITFSLIIYLETFHSIVRGRNINMLCVYSLLMQTLFGLGFGVLRNVHLFLFLTLLEFLIYMLRSYNCFKYSVFVILNM